MKGRNALKNVNEKIKEGRTERGRRVIGSS